MAKKIMASVGRIMKNKPTLPNVTESKLKKFELRGSQVYDPQEMMYISFMSPMLLQHQCLLCVHCGEFLGDLTDENVEHNSEYHSCPSEPFPTPDTNTK